MNQAIKETLKNIPRSRCAKCNSGRSYTNPLAVCHSCKQKFCFDHILGGQSFEGMKDTDSYIDLCEECVVSQHPAAIFFESN